MLPLRLLRACTTLKPSTTSESELGPLLDFLQRSGCIPAGMTVNAQPLTGGVSSDIWKIDLADGRTLCVKRALARLKVAQTWEAPIERNRYERLWLDTANRIRPGIAPQVLADDDAGYFAMTYLDPQHHPLWKTELANARVQPDFADSLGEALVQLHAATANDTDLAMQFRTDASFYALRLEPYLVATARAHPDLAEALQSLVTITAQHRVALVHGDVSPKNILCGPAGPILLDAECAWFGDPAFDLAFCLNHLLLKCLWVPQARAALLQSARALSGRYLAGVHWETPALLEARAAALLPGLLLARIDGKSPVEYIQTEVQKNQVRMFARYWITRPSPDIFTLCQAWHQHLHT